MNMWPADPHMKQVYLFLTKIVTASGLSFLYTLYELDAKRLLSNMKIKERSEHAYRHKAKILWQRSSLTDKIVGETTF